jgi:hypothetical protein
MTAFALIVVALNGLALAGLYVLTTNERLVQMVGAFATSLLFLVLGALRLRRSPRGGLIRESSGIARAGAVSVAAGLVVLASGVVGSRWIGPTDWQFIQQENVRNAAAIGCEHGGGHLVGDLCREQQSNIFRLPPAPIDWTFDEEGG